MEVQFMRAANSKKSKAEGAKKVISKGKAHIGGDWQLIGTDGKPVSHKDFEGKYYLIYFGFCNCPDICPNSLMKLAKALEKVRKSSDAKFFNIESVFVSVDPDRDTHEKI
jgi:protein SCO1/2